MSHLYGVEVIHPMAILFVDFAAHQFSVGFDVEWLGDVFARLVGEAVELHGDIGLHRLVELQSRYGGCVVVAKGAKELFAQQFIYSLLDDAQFIWRQFDAHDVSGLLSCHIIWCSCGGCGRAAVAKPHKYLAGVRRARASLVVEYLFDEFSANSGYLLAFEWGKNAFALLFAIGRQYGRAVELHRIWCLGKR